MRCRPPQATPNRVQIAQKSLQNHFRAPWEGPWARWGVPGSLVGGSRDAPGGCQGPPGRTCDAPGPPRAPSPEAPERPRSVQDRTRRAIFRFPGAFLSPRAVRSAVATNLARSRLAARQRRHAFRTVFCVVLQGGPRSALRATRGTKRARASQEQFTTSQHYTSTTCSCSSERRTLLLLLGRLKSILRTLRGSGAVSKARSTSGHVKASQYSELRT